MTRHARFLRCCVERQTGDLVARGRALGSILVVGVSVALSVLHGCASTERSAASATAPAEQYTFSSPEEAGLALANAAANLDGEALSLIFGPGVNGLSSGDAAQDDIDLQRFAIAYDRRHAIQPEGDDVAFLAVGLDATRFPVPIVRANGRWFFDTWTGVEYVRARRIEMNEASAIEALTELSSAQTIYFEMDPDSDGRRMYALRIASTAGRRDGLYWDDSAGAPDAPVGMEFAAADVEGPFEREPADGYLFRVMPRAESDVPAPTTMPVMLAWPATYGDTGVMTFAIVEGVLWQRDLGPATGDAVTTVRAIDASGGWQRLP